MDADCPGCIATAVGACITAVGGCLAAYAAVVRARHRGSDECERELAEARAESEALAGELHKRRLA